MKRFVVAAALAVALGLGYSGKADAQIVYGYTVPNAGGVVSGGTVLVPGGYQTFNNYYSPFTGVVTRQVYGQDVFGQSFGRSSGYNSFTGMGYRSGFYQPNAFVNPFGGYNYNNVYSRRWGW
jgi:hypothetical protein